MITLHRVWRVKGRTLQTGAWAVSLNGKVLFYTIDYPGWALA